MRMRTKKWAKPELAACPYYIDNPASLRGQWAGAFKKLQPMWLELGCGKGYYLQQAGIAHPDRNLVGIDISSDVLGVARRRISESYAEVGREVDNLILAWQDIERITGLFAPEDAMERMFINFCNPWFKPAQYKHRLTHIRQLEQYLTFLAPDGEIWFKTDDDTLFTHSLVYFKEAGLVVTYQTDDLHQSGFTPNYMTEHEIMYSEQGIKIKFAIAKR